MSSTKCSKCGLTNFLSAEHCKRCQTSLSPAAAPEESISSPAEAPLLSVGDPRKEIVPVDDKPRRVLSPLRILVVILLLIGAVWYQINRDDNARAAQAKADKEFDQKRQADDQAAQMGRMAH